MTKLLLVAFLFAGCSQQTGYTEAMCNQTCQMVGAKMNRLSLAGGCVCEELRIEARR